MLTRSVGSRCDLFNKAFNHIAERIDEVYKGLTKGKAAPVGGVAYLSLEDSEVSIECQVACGRSLTHCWVGTLFERDQVPCDAADEAIPRYGSALGRGKDNGCARVTLCDP